MAANRPWNGPSGCNIKGNNKKRRNELVTNSRLAVIVPFASPEARLVDDIVHAARAVKGKGIHVLKLDDSSSIADYLVLISGRSDRQVQGIANRILDMVQTTYGDYAICGVEGMEQGQWVLLDLGEVIVHVFYEAVREHYAIDRLWTKAQVFDLSDERSTFLPRTQRAA